MEPPRTQASTRPARRRVRDRRRVVARGRLEGRGPSERPRHVRVGGRTQRDPRAARSEQAVLTRGDIACSASGRGAEAPHSRVCCYTFSGHGDSGSNLVSPCSGGVGYHRRRQLPNSLPRHTTVCQAVQGSTRPASEIRPDLLDSGGPGVRAAHRCLRLRNLEHRRPAADTQCRSRPHSALREESPRG